MPDLAALVQQGAAAPFAMVVAALLLGALHALEPGHSKTMMAAFIIAVRGTVGQAVLLGLAAAFSHTLIVWILALAGLTWGDALIGPRFEPWFLLGSGLVMFGVALWVFVSTWRHRRRAAHHHHHHHDHHHHGDHDFSHDHHHHDHDHVHHDVLHHDHDHDHGGLDEDAHARAHASAIARRFADGHASNWQVVGFGLTGGLLPCAAAVTVLLVCLQLDRFWLGVGLVAAFSAGLALTLVAVGVVAAVGVAAARRRTTKLDDLFARAPYLSAALIAVIGTIMLVSGIEHLAGTG